MARIATHIVPTYAELLDGQEYKFLPSAGAVQKAADLRKVSADELFTSKDQFGVAVALLYYCCKNRPAEMVYEDFADLVPLDREFISEIMSALFKREKNPPVPVGANGLTAGEKTGPSALESSASQTTSTGN